MSDQPKSQAFGGADRRKPKADAAPRKAGELVGEVLGILAKREITMLDIARTLDQARKLDPKSLDQAIATFNQTAMPKRADDASTARSAALAESFQPALRRMRANSRQRLIFKQLRQVYGTADRAMYVLTGIAKALGYREPSEEDLRNAGHYAGAHHAAAVIATALWVQPYDLWPKVLASAGAAQGIYVRDQDQLEKAREAVLSPFKKLDG